MTAPTRPADTQAITALATVSAPPTSGEPVPARTLSRAHQAPVSAARAPELLALTGVSKVFGATARPGGWQRALQAARLTKPARPVHAVQPTDLTVGASEVVGLVGESGCGKSTLGRMAAGLLAPSAGTITLQGQPIDALPIRERLRVQMIFQDAYASLNPRLRVERIVGEGAIHHGLAGGTPAERDAYVCAQLERAGLDPSLRFRYAHQFSGGQRQRIGIARALAVQPRLLVCDEAVAALDVSIQAQVLNLFLELRERLSLAYLFISHDLSVIRHVSDRVVVMYLGRVVESAPVDELFAHPNHPYTQALFAQIPRLSQRRQRFIPIRGEIPSPLAPPPGCHFAPRCPHAMARCHETAPALREISPGHASACHLNDLS